MPSLFDNPNLRKPALNVLLEDLVSKGGPQNLAAGLIGGATGLPGDIQQGAGLLSRQLPIALQAAGSALFGGGQRLPGSEKITGLLGGDLNRPITQAGLIGAPDPRDLGKGLLAMTLFHGSPAKFNKFSLDKIGTGEGAQAFGSGLYFAENKGVAKSYASNLGTTDTLIDGAKVGPDDIRFEAATSISANGFDDALANAKANSEATFLTPDGRLRESEIASQIESLRGAKITDRQISSLYEVEIPDNVTDKMLDWDAPLSEQPESVQLALKNIIQDNGVQIPSRGMNPDLSFGQINKSNPNGNILYESLVEKFGSKEAASKVLNEADVPGIRFLDASSRSKGEGTRNIVVFNPDDITQVKRDGELVFENKLGFR